MDTTDALKASMSGTPVKPLRCTMKKDEVKDALLTLVLVLVLQGDFQQSKDYIQKLSETCAQDSSGDHAFGGVSMHSSGGSFGTGDAASMQGTSEFSSLLVDFVVCTLEFLELSLGFSPSFVVLVLMRTEQTACETSDVAGMKWCQKELWPFLQARQNELVHRIIALKFR